MVTPWWLSGFKESACQCRRCKFDPWSERSPGRGDGNPLQYSCLGNPRNGEAWWTAVHGVAKELDMTCWLNNKNSVVCVYPIYQLKNIYVVLVWGAIMKRAVINICIQMFACTQISISLWVNTSACDYLVIWYCYN